MQTLKQIEKEAISLALINNNFSMTRVRMALGISRSTLYRKIKKYNLKTKSDLKIEKED